MTIARWVNNNAYIKHEDRGFSQIQFVVVLSWLTFYLFHIVLQLSYEGLTLLFCYLPFLPNIYVFTKQNEGDYVWQR